MKQPWLKLLLILLPTVLGLEFLTWVTLLPTMVSGGADFRQLYVAGYMVRTGHSNALYDYNAQSQVQSKYVTSKGGAIPFLRPAYQALVIAPFTFFSFRVAYLFWMLLNCALLVVLCVFVQRRFFELGAIWKPLPALALCAFPPIWIAVSQGQDTVLLLALIAGTFVALEKNRESLAGCLLALGLFKFQIVLPIAGLFALWKRWRFLQGFFATASVLAGTSFLLIGLRGVAAFLNSITHIHYPVRYETMSNLHALLVGVFGNSFTVTVATMVLSAVALVAVAIWSPAESASDSLMIAIPTAALVSYYLYPHDSSVLIFPLLFAMTLGVTRSFDGWAALLMFLSPLLFLLAGQPFLESIPMVLLLISTVRGVALRAAEPCSSPWPQSDTGFPASKSSSCPR